VVLSGTPASSTTKADRHDIAEILLKVALNTKKIKSVPGTHEFTSVFSVVDVTWLVALISLLFRFTVLFTMIVASSFITLKRFGSHYIDN
jgi:hypothetical protein